MPASAVVCAPTATRSIRARRACVPRSVQGQLKPFMARDEAERAVEAVRLRTALVAGQLDHAAALLAGHLDKPADQPAAVASSAEVRCDADGLDLRAPHSAPAKARDDGELGAARQF